MNIQNDTFILSKRGWLISAVAATVFLFFTMTGLHLFQFVSGAVLIIILAVFRNPERNTVQTESDAIISNVDGVVLSVEAVEIDMQKLTKVTIFNGLWDVSMLRAPFDGTVEGAKIRNGLSLPLYNPVSETLNEKAVLSFRSVQGNEIYIEHMSEQSCFPIGMELEKGERYKEGGRYGFMAKGRTTLYIPSNAAVSVSPGVSVRAGESIIGRFEAA